MLDAIAQARVLATPEIWNTDQGSHFTSPQVTEPLCAAGVKISMDGKGRATDNIFTERLWRSVKYETMFSVQRRMADYEFAKALTWKELQDAHDRWVGDYNFQVHVRPVLPKCTAVQRWEAGKE